MLRINPALRKLWLSPNAVQYGYPNGVRIENLESAQEHFLAFIEQGFLPEQIPVLAQISGCPEASHKLLLEKLSPIVADWYKGFDDLPETLIANVQPEISRLLRRGEVPGEVLRKRVKTRIYISDLGDFGEQLTFALSMMGYCHFLTDDSKLMSSRGRSPNFRNRLEEVKSRLPKHCRLQLHSLLHDSTIRATGIAILVEFEAPNPIADQVWQSADISIIRARFSESRVVIEPAESFDIGRIRSLEASHTSEGQNDSAQLQIQLAARPRRFESQFEIIEATLGVIREVERITMRN